MTFGSRPNGFGAKGTPQKKYAVANFFCRPRVGEVFAGLGYEVKRIGSIVVVVLSG